MQDLNQRLMNVIEQRKLKKKLEQDLISVQKELEENSSRLAALSDQLDKEKVDVEKLERTSLTALFYSVLGNREQQLEKERQELLGAQLRYQQMKHQVESLEWDRDHLSQQLARLQGVDSEYTFLLSEKERFLQQSDLPVAQDLVACSEQIAGLNAELKEIGEAIAAGKKVVSGLGEVLQSLEEAQNWGTWDMLGGGLLVTAAKHSRIDDARDGVNRVQALMNRFRRELADVKRIADIQIDISSFESFADYFFDGLIVDWVVQSKIVDSLNQSRQALETVQQTVRNLQRLEKSTREKIDGLQKKRTSLIEQG